MLAAFPNAFPAGVHAEVVGNPVRAEIVSQPEPVVRFARREGALRLLVVGGSLGATRLNTVVPFAIEQSGLSLHVRHQAGARGIDAARAAYEEAGVQAEVTPFIEDMAQAYAEADLVIVNHHLLCADAAVRRHSFGEVIPECQVGIVDEARRATPLDEECAAHEKELVEQKRKPLWVGAVREKCVVALRVPE